jgi:FdhE protein
MGPDAPPPLVSQGHRQVSASVWDRRMDRARDLAATIPETADLLRFYQQVAAFQRTVAESDLPSLPLDSPELAAALRPYVEQLSALLPPDVSREEAFLCSLVLQPYAEREAHSSRVSRTNVQPVCPFCAEKPVLAVLRPEGEGGKRYLVCSLCSTEWEFRRLLCPQCGEEDKEKLPIFTAEQFPYIRLEMCDTCQTYMKAIDLTKNGLAVPEVDDLASVALDLWADEKGYTKLQVNLFGL